MRVALGRLLLCLCSVYQPCLGAASSETRSSSTDLVPATQGPFRPHAYNDDLDSGLLGHYPTHKYITPEMPTPHTNFRHWAPECDDGLYYFITPKGWSVKSPGPMILDRDGEAVWAQHFDNQFGGQAYNLRVQSYKREPHLTFWLGDDRVVGHGFGYYYVLNSSYDIVHRVGMANGSPLDLHECILTQEGTAMVIAYEVIVGDLSPLHPPATLRSYILPTTYIWDSIIQEYDIESGNLIFEWRASNHVNISATYRTVTADSGTQKEPFDWFHANSIHKDDLWNYVISVRYTQAIYYIHGRTHEILWVLGGRDNMFMDIGGGQALNFAWQHDAQFVPLDAFPDLYTPPEESKGMTTRLMTIFDNAAEDWNYDYGPPYSRGMLLELTFPAQRPQKPDPMHRGDYHYHEATDDPDGLDEPASYKTPQDAKLPPSSRTTKKKPNPLNQPLSATDAAKIADINAQSPLYTVRVVQEWVHPQRLRSSSQGGLQILPQGPPSSGLPPKILIGYGLNAAIAEFAPNGSILCDMHFGAASSWETGHVASYRAYKFPWTGRPRTPPILALRTGDNAFVSWNGATEVAAWRILVSDSPAVSDDDNPSSSSPASHWIPLITLPKTRFETHLALSSSIQGLQAQQSLTEQQQPPSHAAASPPRRSSIRYIRAIALDAAGHPLPHGASNVVDRGVLSAMLERHFGKRSGSVWNGVVGGVSWVSGIALVLLVARWAFSRRRQSAGRGARIAEDGPRHTKIV